MPLGIGMRTTKIEPFGVPKMELKESILKGQMDGITT